MKDSKNICPVCTIEIKEKKEDIRTNLFAYNLKKAIICDWCLKEFEETFSSKRAPKILKCGETFCFDCLKKNFKNDSIICPICRKVNNEQLEDIPVNKCAITLVEEEILNNVNNVEFLKVNDNTKNFDYELSIAIMGEGNVGKTCMTHYFYKGVPLRKSISTVGFEFHYKFLSIKNKKIKLRLWDTAGQELYRSYTMGLLRGVNAVMIVFSLANPYNEKICKELYNEWKNADEEKKEKIEENLKEKAFAEVRSFYQQFLQFNNPEETVIYLIGNKVDDVENRIIKKKDAMNLAKELSVKYFETSAMTGENIYMIFSSICLDIINKIKDKLNNNKIKIELGNKKSICSC